VNVKPRSEDEAKRASSRKQRRPGWYPAEFNEVTEKTSKADNEMLECGLLVTDTNGDQFPVTDWLVDVDAGAAKLRSAVIAVDALARYEAGEIGAEDFVGRPVEVKIVIVRRRGFRDRLAVEAYRPVSAASVVSFPRAS
jgi:hypothetical protein